MQSLSQNAGLQQSIPPIMSPSHSSQNYGMYQSQQSFPQNTGGSMMQQGDLYQMPGQQSSSYYGGGSYPGYGSGYPNQTSKQRDLANSSGYQTNFQQTDAYGSAGSLQNFGQFDAPPLSPTQHQASVLSSSTMHAGMMHSGNSFSYGSVPRVSTGSAIPQQMQMQASGFQGSLQHPVSSSGYSQIQMSNQGSISVGSTGYSAYAGPARTRSSPVSQQSITMSNVPGSFSGISPPSPKQMHLPCRTLGSPVLQQMQPTRSQSNHPLRSPGSASHSKQSATSPFTHPNSSPPPLTGIVQRSPTPVQQIYGNNAATQQLSPHSQFSLQSAPPQLPCMYGWGNDALATGSLPSPTQLRHLQQMINDEDSGNTLPARAPNSRSVIQPTGINKMPSPVSRKAGGGSILSRKHSAGTVAAGTVAAGKPGPSAKVPKLDSYSPPKNKRRSPCNVIANKDDLTVTGEQTEKSVSETVGQVKTGSRNGISPSELGVAQLKETINSEEDQGQIVRHVKNRKIENDIEAQQKDMISDKDISKVIKSDDDVYDSVTVDVEHNENEESVKEIKSVIDSMKTEDETNTVENTGGKTETKLKDGSHSESLKGGDENETLKRTDEDKTFLKPDEQLSQKCEQKMAEESGASHEMTDKESFKTKQLDKKLAEAEKNEQVQLFNHENSAEFSEKILDSKSFDQLGLLKEKSPDPKITDSFKENKGRSRALDVEESSSLLNTSGDETEKLSAADERPESLNSKTTSDSPGAHHTEKKGDEEETIEGDLMIDTKEKLKKSTIKPTADANQEMTLMNKPSKSTGVQSVVVTSVAGGTTALSGTTAITASVIAKGQAQGTGQQVLVAKTPSGQMYLIQGNVLIPVQNVQVQQEKGKNGSKVIVVNPAQGTSGKHSTIKTTSTVTKHTSSADSQKTIKSKPNILSHSSDKRQQIGNYQTQEQEVAVARRDNKLPTISISSKERLKEKIVGNLDAKIKVIEQTERHIESNLTTSPSSKGSPNFSAKGKKIGRPLGSKDKQKRKPYASRRSNSLSTIESVVDEPSTQVETQNKKGQRGRPRKSESERLTPQKAYKRTVALDVPTVGYTPEGTKKTKYSTRIPSIKFISVIPKGCGIGDTWCCCLCGKPPHFGYLGVLFGPYKVKLLSREMVESCSRKSPSSKLLSPISKSKQIAENSETAIGTDSETQVLELWVHKECAVWSHGVYMQGKNLEGLEQVAESATQHVSIFTSLKTIQVNMGESFSCR